MTVRQMSTIQRKPSAIVKVLSSTPSLIALLDVLAIEDMLHRTSQLQTLL